MSSLPKKILITGVAGFIGSNLADMLLKNGHAVVGIDNLSYGIREQVPAGVEFHELDIRSRDIYPVFEGVDYVFHLAAKNCIADCQADPVETADINVAGTANVFEAADRARVKKVIYAESSAVYEGIKKLPAAESRIAPESFYAISKAAEAMFADAYHRFRGMTFTALRYLGVYGPRQDSRRSIPPLPSAFIMKLLKGESATIYGAGDKRRDIIHVDDINAFHMLCLADPRTDNQTFNLGNGKSYSVREMYDIVSRVLGTTKEVVTKPDLPGEAFATLADISKARSIGWEPKIPLEKGIEGVVAYIKDEFAKGRVK